MFNGSVSLQGGGIRGRPTVKRLASVIDPALDQLYRDMAAAGLMPLWTQREDLMTTVPQPDAVAHHWRWADLLPLAERAGAQVAVGRGGERRALALANPGLAGLPYATGTLWAAIQYLGGGEEAPAHRHPQNAFRFVLHGAGTWTVVDGDPIAMRRGDLLLTPGMAWHEHHNTADQPMIWLDGLDIPLVRELNAGFFEFGPERISDRATPANSRGERLWAHPGLRPLGVEPAADAASPLAAYRWAHTDAALTCQLLLEREGQPGVLGPGHAAVRFVNPATGGDPLATLRMEMHRLTPGSSAHWPPCTGSAVWQVFQGEGDALVGTRRFPLTSGDLLAIPPWTGWRLEASSPLDLFTFTDRPVYEALRLLRRGALTDDQDREESP
jgi:gentisate 1,2-dioxygenase